jgi:phosphatidylglycerol lysyltransferase
LHLGLKKLKVGDDAIVDLTQFSLEGKSGYEFRKKIRTMEKLGIRTESHEPPIPETVMRQVKEVSDEWLLLPGRRERRFTLGLFDPHYVRSTTVFAVYDAGGRMLAFLNVIPPYRRGETTADLMRRRTDAPNGVMDYLFVKLFLEQKERGVERFNLGMAPMAGFHEREEPTPEERAVHYFFQRLNFLFSFRGLRNFKAKFASHWEPRYTIYRNVFELPQLALAISRVSEFED